ncbi:endochitinase A [Strongylocentrotus purpuratus]|uniref:Uncharacterized protein n=1 Tax=Strongylocentrotus purpuratus TaxID=7668 RepID=A0A7M7NHG5_STRPU|nr:endochitinase A [Strongylocentrotus purpuratus]
MGNCLKSCFGSVKTKRTDYFSGRFNNSSIDIEFENLIDDDEVQQNHAVLTDDERTLLQNRRYTDLVQEQQKIDARLDKELELEEENARLEEEAYNAAKQESSRATKRARLLEMEKKRLKTQQSNGSTKAWLGDDAGDWEVATEDDFEAFLDTVKAKSETVRASVASMLNTNTTPTTTNQAVTKQPTSPKTSPMVQASTPTSYQSVNPTSSGSAKTNLQSTVVTSSSPSLASPKTSVAQHDTPSVQFNSLKTQGGKLGSSDDKNQGLVDGPEQVANKPDVVQASRRVTQGVGQNDVKEEEEGTEASGKMSHYIKPGSKSPNHHDDDDDSDVEWEADFVSADSPSEPITITPQSSPAKLPTSQSIGSSNSTTIPSRHEPTRTGLPSSSRTNGSSLANGQLPYKHEAEKEIETSVTEGKTLSNGGTKGVKAKKTLDIDIDKFLEELDFDT